MTMRTLLTALVLTALAGCGGASSEAICEPGSSDPCNDQGQGPSEGSTFPLALQGVEWQLVTVERQSREEDVQDLASSLVFDAAVVSGRTCNSFGAEVAVATPDRITTGSFDSTRMGCGGPAGEVDRLIQELLHDGATWKRDQARLTLTHEDVQLTYVPAGAAKPSQAPDATFEIAYDPATYDPELVEPALTKCAELPGASRADYQMDSLPPIDVVTFTGSGGEKQAVEDCLRRVPAARVSIR